MMIQIERHYVRGQRRSAFNNGTRPRKVTSGPHLGYKLPVLLVQVGCGCHIVLPDADLALFRRSGQEQNHIIIISGSPQLQPDIRTIKGLIK